MVCEVPDLKRKRSFGSASLHPTRTWLGDVTEFLALLLAGDRGHFYWSLPSRCSGADGKVERWVGHRLLCTMVGVETRTERPGRLSGGGDSILAS